MTRDQFEILVNQGIAALPEWVRSKMRNVAFLIADEPTQEQRIENDLIPGDTLFGLYEGIPLSERGETEEIMLPDRITIFMKPILSAYTDESDIRACVRNTIWHEVAHHFGHDEAWVAREEEVRGMQH